MLEEFEKTLLPDAPPDCRPFQSGGRPSPNPVPLLPRRCGPRPRETLGHGCLGRRLALVPDAGVAGARPFARPTRRLPSGDCPASRVRMEAVRRIWPLLLLLGGIGCDLVTHGCTNPSQEGFGERVDGYLFPLYKSLPSRPAISASSFKRCDGSVSVL